MAIGVEFVVALGPVTVPLVVVALHEQVHVVTDGVIPFCSQEIFYAFVERSLVVVGRRKLDLVIGPVQVQRQRGVGAEVVAVFHASRKHVVASIEVGATRLIIHGPEWLEPIGLVAGRIEHELVIVDRRTEVGVDMGTVIPIHGHADIACALF